MQAIAGRHGMLALALIEFLAECAVLCSKVPDRDTGFLVRAVTFSVSDGGVGGPQGFDRLAGVAAA